MQEKINIWKNESGSALILTMVILISGVLIFSSIISVSLMQRSASSKTRSSTEALQIADGCIEWSLKQYYEASGVRIDEVGGIDTSNGNVFTWGLAADSLPLAINIGSESYDVDCSIYLVDSSGEIMNDDAKDLSEVSEIRVVAGAGFGEDRTRRAVQVGLTRSVVFSASDDGTVKAISSSGNELWSFEGHSGSVGPVAVDADGYVYSGGSDHTVRKIKPDGSEDWSFLLGGSVSGVAVDTDGNVYASTGSGDNKVVKISQDGSVQLWEFTLHTGTVSDVAVDENGNVYSSSYDNTVRKLRPADGSQDWRFDGFSSDVRQVAVDSDGYVYAGGSNRTVKKIKPDGSEDWTFSEHSSYIYGLAVDADGYVYSGSRDDSVKKIKPDGSSSDWTFSLTNTIHDVVVDSDGYVYSGSEDNILRKIKPDGSGEDWRFEGHTGNVSGIAVSPGLEGAGFW